ncbi:hypothetical protein [Opitutus sp. ER46]|uniref:hypothetical protein n=1 Tax=Opitutus sp. ER46 TaxID=2161864 RepID=UPI000D315A12|nr:hypothetical protein [Opitutus sp. ER46]PTX96581.1 hypothetical protein DB354_07960 [Opitutus sp. ER46]
MKSRLYRHTRIAQVLGAVALVALLYNIVVLALVLPRSAALQAIPPWAETAGLGVGLGILLTGLQHLAALWILVSQIRITHRIGLATAAVCLMGVTSLLLLGADVTLLGDIGHEYRAGLGTTRECQMVAGFHGLHLSFVILAGWIITLTNRSLQAGPAPEAAEQDEAFILTTHYVGVLSGTLVLTILVVLAASGLPAQYLRRMVITFQTVATVPYLLALGACAAIRWRRPLTQWLDERALINTGLASLATLATSLLVLGIGYAFQETLIPASLVTVLWFPAAVGLGMAVFSGSSLWLARYR